MSPFGVRSIWLRNDLATMKDRLKGVGYRWLHGDFATAIDPLRVPPLVSQCKRLEIGTVVLGLA